MAKEQIQRPKKISGLAKAVIKNEDFQKLHKLAKKLLIDYYRQRIEDYKERIDKIESNEFSNEVYLNKRQRDKFETYLHRMLDLGDKMPLELRNEYLDVFNQYADLVIKGKKI
jgi:hypothetical protein